LQRINKKLKSYGLWKYYKNNDALYCYIKKLMAVVLLQSSQMDNAYQLLCEVYLKNEKLKMYTTQLKRLLHYYGRQWMKLSIRPMLIFHRAQFRTNNWNECE
jgi:hypothetical protein